jgi:hypothetical protein
MCMKRIFLVSFAAYISEEVNHRVNQDTDAGGLRLSSKVNFQDGQVLAVAVASTVVPFSAAVVHAASVVTMRAPTTRCAASTRIHSCGTVVERTVVSVVAALCRPLIAQMLHRPRVIT